MNYLQVVKGSEILEVLYGLPDIREYLFSLYECKYEQFFKHLGKLYIPFVHDLLFISCATVNLYQKVKIVFCSLFSVFQQVTSKNKQKLCSSNILPICQEAAAKIIS